MRVVVGYRLLSGGVIEGLGKGYHEIPMRE
jgi:hypothetical protein